MRSYSGRVAYGVLALVFGVASWGCSGSTDVIPTGPGTNPDAGDAGDVQPEGGDADTGTCEYTLTFAAPMDGAQLTETDDANGDFCADGFQYNVTVATNAPDGTTVSLYGNAGKIADANAAAGLVQFLNVQLPSMGSETLRVEIPQTECSRTAQVSVACEGAPECEITLPDITATHPELNGVPVAEGGDRVSAAGSPYQVAFEVSTNVGDGQPVILNVDGTVSAVSTNAVGGVASFPGVTLSPDGDHTVVARCVPKVGIEGQSTQTTYAVDTQAPPLSAKKVKENAAITDLQDGDHWNPEDDADPATDGLQIRVCGTTDSASAADALDLPASLGAGQQNFCVAVGTSSPACTPATTGGADTAGDGACVNIECPGGGPFDLTLTLRDDAGNPTEKKVQGLSCASELPQVQFLDPVSDGPPWSDINKRILAASMAGQVQRVDEDAATAGAQYRVVGCTSATAGSARLLAGTGGTLTEIANTAVANDSAGLCAATGLSNVLAFPTAKIPESLQHSAGALDAPTELRIEVTDASNGLGTSTIALWVDSESPTISPFSPTPLCGKVYQSNIEVAEHITLLSTNVPVTLAVTNAGSTQTYQGTVLVGAQVDMGTVTFPLGENLVTATVQEPSGNRGSLQTPCTVTVGNPPIITWETPTNGARLAASSTSGAQIIPDADAAAPGWQGMLRVCSDIDISVHPGATIQFSTNVGGNLGSPLAIDSSGCATFDPADLPEGDSVALMATTSPIDGLSGVATITAAIDVQVPDAVGSLSASVLSRRQTSFHATWTSPGDHGKPASAYQVRRSTNPIQSESDFANAISIGYSGTPTAVGTTDGIDVTDLLIEKGYYFAVAAVDVAGNRSAIQSTGPHSAAFNTTILTPNVVDAGFGITFDGSSDLNGDNLADLVVGTQGGSTVYLYFGASTGYPSTPSVTISGAETYFGLSLAVVGDVDGDGRSDIAIGSPFAGNGKVFVFKGRSTWPSALQESDANYLIDVGATFAGSLFGYTVKRLGDFNGDGIDDFAIGAPFYNSLDGAIAVVFGSQALPSAVYYPDDYGQFGVQITGVVGEKGRFGFGIVGFGPYYSGAGTTMLSGANFASKVYAFRGQQGTGGTIALSEADSVMQGAPTARTGETLSVLRSVGLPNPVSVVASPGGAGSIELRTGTPAQGPFSSVIATLTSTSSPATARLGDFLQTGTYSGTTISASVIGDSSPDLVTSWATVTGAAGLRVYIVDGTRAVTLGTADLETTADVIHTMPADWNTMPVGTNHFVRDLDGDGYADIALGEAALTGSSGRLLVLW